MKSMGSILEDLNSIQEGTLTLSRKMSEPLETKLAEEVHDLSQVVADAVYLLREHLSCHDCRVVDHTHTPDDVTHNRRVTEVYPHQMIG